MTNIHPSADITNINASLINHPVYSIVSLNTCDLKLSIFISVMYNQNCPLPIFASRLFSSLLRISSKNLHPSNWHKYRTAFIRDEGPVL